MPGLRGDPCDAIGPALHAEVGVHKVSLVGAPALRLVGCTLAANVSASFADSHFLPNCTWITLEADGDGWRCLDWAGVTP